MNGRLDSRRDSSGISRRSVVALPALETIMILVVCALITSAAFPGITIAKPSATMTSLAGFDVQTWIPPSFDIEIEPPSMAFPAPTDAAIAHR